jgi:hypothetical protein
VKKFRLRLIIGIVCIGIGIWMFLSGELTDNPAPAIAVTVIGVILIVLAKRRKK